MQSRDPMERSSTILSTSNRMPGTNASTSPREWYKGSGTEFASGMACLAQELVYYRGCYLLRVRYAMSGTDVTYAAIDLLSLCDAQY